MSTTSTAVGRILGIGDEGASALADQIGLHRELGWSAIELRTVDGSGLHDIPVETHQRHAAALREAGIGVPVLDTPVGGWAYDVSRPVSDDLRMLETYAEIGRLYGSDRMRVMSYPNDGRSEAEWRREVLKRMAALATTAGELGVTLLHENCHGWAATDPVKSLDMLAEVGSPHLTLLFDTGNGVSYGYDSVEFLTPVVSHVGHVHLKDSALFGGEPAFVGLGEGDSRVAECVAVLERAGYTGLYSIEPHLHLVPHQRKVGDDARKGVEYLAYARQAEDLLSQVLEAEVGRAVHGQERR
ncbi:hypothetical protein SMCF_7391 [Streptomyces coelicoflavus ZG0656]|nr:hypothetical protein SMCF_7391 [Streptomyces coelicoflavus ZG0656]MZE49250.1 TIM barrel protein [Streptomyces sp. SID5477]